MGSLQVNQGIVERKLSAVIIRCKCDDAASHEGASCPTGQIEQLGVISYWHRNPLRRLAHKIGQALVAKSA